MNSSKRKTFTFGQAIEVQRDDLRRWKLILNDNTFAALESECRLRNNMHHDSPYDVFRGCQLSTWIQNYSIALSR